MVQKVKTYKKNSEESTELEQWTKRFSPFLFYVFLKYFVLWGCGYAEIGEKMWACPSSQQHSIHHLRDAFTTELKQGPRGHKEMSSILADQ